ncbi:MAG: hypothetical protein LC739_00855, partial [Actinobacteria bacterium]|nr:hypothetical protein [Actinomycetota bacterium]
PTTVPMPIATENPITARRSVVAIATQNRSVVASSPSVSDEAYELASADRTRHVLEGSDRRVAIAVGLGNSENLDRPVWCSRRLRQMYYRGHDDTSSRPSEARISASSV